MKTAAPRCWGIYRELAHSPGRETDDAEILRATAAELAARGFDVSLKSTDELPEVDDVAAVPPFLFVMCERIPVVEKLAAWERRGALVVNRPGGHPKHRPRAHDRALRRARGPVSRRASSSRPGPAGPRSRAPAGSSAATSTPTEAGDVAFAGDAAALAAHLARLSDPRDRPRRRPGPRSRGPHQVLRRRGPRRRAGPAVLVPVVLPPRPEAGEPPLRRPPSSPPRPPGPPRRFRSRSTAATRSSRRTAGSA